MNHSSFENRDLLDLLVDRATTGLDPDQQVALENELNQLGLDDDWSFEQTAAIVDESYGNEPMPQLPTHLKNKILDEAEQLVSSSTATDIDKLDSIEQDGVSGSLTRPQSAEVDTPSSNTGSLNTRKTSSGLNGREMFAWLVTAASLAFAAFLIFSRDQGTTIVRTQPLIGSVSQAQFESFVSENKDAFQVDLAAGSDANGENATASIVWDRQTKRGVLKVAGLKPNDPSTEQYQLWVIDKVRGIEDRPNAGVFDVDKDGQAFFEFRSDLEVFNAQGFAVTVEKPGGVNKSDLSRIALANLGS